MLPQGGHRITNTHIENGQARGPAPTVCLHDRRLIQNVHTIINVGATPRGYPAPNDGCPVSDHRANVDSGELFEDAVISILETTAADGKHYNTRYLNLHAAIDLTIDVQVNMEAYT